MNVLTDAEVLAAAMDVVVKDLLEPLEFLTIAESEDYAPLTSDDQEAIHDATTTVRQALARALVNGKVDEPLAECLNE